MKSYNKLFSMVEHNKKTDPKNIQISYNPIVNPSFTNRTNLDILIYEIEIMIQK